jgi:hypothetical protein
LGEPDKDFKAYIVALILSRKTEEAVQILSEKYRVEVPNLGVGHVKGKKKAAGVYVTAKKMILVSNGENMWDPFIILHEFYHHIRNEGGRQLGNEKLADAFARDYINVFKEQISRKTFFLS